MLAAGIHMYVGAVSQLFAGTGNYLLQMALSLVEFVLLHSPQTGLIVLHSLCKTGVLVHRSRGLQVYLLPFAFDDSPANLRRCLMLFVLSIRVINLLQAGGALRSVRVLKATVKTVVAHAVAIAIARLLMQYGRNPGGKLIRVSLEWILSILSP